MDVSRADNSVKIWKNLPISNPKPDLQNINAHAKFGENPLMFTQVIIRKRKTDVRTRDGQTDGHTDDQRETIIPRHYCVVGYNKELSIFFAREFLVKKNKSLTRIYGTLYGPYTNFYCNEDLGPVVQSVVSLTSSLRVISLTVLADSIHNILIFFAEKMWVAFFSKKFQHICVSLD